MILHATGFFFFLDDIIHSIAVGCGLQQIQLSFPEKSIVQYKRYKKEQWVPFYISLSYMMAIPHMPDENCDAMSNKENPMSEIAGARVSGPMNLKRNPTSPSAPTRT